MDPTTQIDGLVPNGANGLISYGTVAQKLMANNFNVSALRTNDVLRKEEWLLFDRTVVEIARANLIGVSDLMGANLSVPIPNAMGITVVQHETMSDMTAAEINMTGLADSQRDRPVFAQVNVPLPIIHKDFFISLRNLQSSRRLGMPLDTTMAGVAARRVSDAIEDMLFSGASITAGGGTIYGYTNFTSRNTGAVAANWSTVATGEQMLADTISMISAAQADNMYGSYQMYVSIAAYNRLLNDFKANSDKTTLQRILEIPQIRGIKATTRLSGTNVLMIQFTPDVIDWLDGLQPTTVMWESQGGMALNFKVLAIGAPRPKADQTGQCGIVHYS